jgi:hypothetical protein
MSLTLQFVPYNDIVALGSARRVNKLMNIVKENKVVLLEGRLKKEEEADLISIAMEEIDNKFKGIELAVIDPKKEDSRNMFKNMKTGFVNLVLGDRQGFTVIGPATIIKEIKKDPNNIQLFTMDAGSKRKREAQQKLADAAAAK